MFSYEGTYNGIFVMPNLLAIWHRCLLTTCWALFEKGYFVQVCLSSLPELRKTKTRERARRFVFHDADATCRCQFRLTFNGRYAAGRTRGRQSLIYTNTDNSSSLDVMSWHFKFPRCNNPSGIFNYIRHAPRGFRKFRLRVRIWERCLRQWWKPGRRVQAVQGS